MSGRTQKPPTPVPLWEPKQGDGDGPPSPDVSKSDTTECAKSIRTNRNVTGSALVNSMDGSNQANPLAGDFLTVLKRRRLISDIPSNPGSRSDFVETTATTILSFKYAGGVLVAGVRGGSTGTLGLYA